MKNRKNVIFATLALSFLMLFSISVFSQGNEAKDRKSMCKSMMNDEALMKECMSQMESKDMMAMCNKMMDKMKEGSSMCDMMMNDKTDGQEMNGERIENKIGSANPDVNKEKTDVKGKSSV